MTTPKPTDGEIAEELTSVLRSEADRVTPEPALQKILARAHEAGPAKTIRRRGGGWLPIIGGVVATAGLVAAAILIFGPGQEKQPTPPPAKTCAVQVQEGCPVDLAVYLTRSDLSTLVGVGVTVKSSGDVGIDAVQALLQAKSNDTLVNPWNGWDTVPPDSGPIAEVTEVTHANAVIKVDFDRPLTTNMTNLQGDPHIGKVLIQQLVLTAQSALGTQDPVEIWADGKPADQAFGVQLKNVGTDTVNTQSARWSWVEGIRPETPWQGMATRSPVTVSGQSSTFEGNVRWEITRDGDQVRQGHTMGGGAPGGYGPYRFRVDLPPGDYILKLWEPNAASGAEAWTGELFVTYTDFRVK
jgi:immunoglobulin-like protein involved in spore germination/sporulation and spore germination protein